MSELPEDSSHPAAAPERPSSGPATAASSGVGRWLVVLAVVALVLGPLLKRLVPKEIAKAHLAVAQEKFLNDDAEGAAAALAKSLVWAPRFFDALAFRAEMQGKAGDHEAALADLEAAFAAAPGALERIHTRILRAEVLHELGRHTDAVAELEPIERQQLAANAAWHASDVTIDHMWALVLNARAYARALAGREVETGLKEINEALRIRGDEEALLDTRGLLRYLLGEFEPALKDLDKAVEKGERLITPENPAQIGDRRVHLRHRESLNRVVAVLRYHRALVLDKLEQPDRAEADRQRVRELGFEPNESLF